MDARAFLESVYRTATDRELTFLAAGVAYYAFVSLLPLVLLALVVGSLVGGEALAERLVLLAGDFLPAAGEELLVTTLTTEAGRAEATVVALLVATWGGLKVFRGLSLAFDRVYDEAARDPLLEQLRDGITVVLAIATGLALMVGVGAVLGLVAHDLPFAGVLGWLALLVGLVIVFLPIYYVLPPVRVTIREILPGTLVAAVGWVLLQAGFQLYAANAGRYQAYGAVGAVLLFVTWLYFAGALVLVGAIVNVVLFRPSLAE
ncbi:YihY/virulence factor BrkB family protein [Halopiger goleimassiliensis]|uniref:YihY/virulence factor BrkB family protein n=1 Tax=Halopiger goleimassiliensis TaxID=1293048 RepID=UPI00067781E8|nr:YihY/virulence factor BrkB family protein [Halopiger goleimassiliensis]